MVLEDVDVSFFLGCSKTPNVVAVQMLASAFPLPSRGSNTVYRKGTHTEAGETWLEIMTVWKPV
jgi:hypothetical protein